MHFRKSVTSYRYYCACQNKFLNELQMTKIYLKFSINLCIDIKLQKCDKEYTLNRTFVLILLKMIYLNHQIDVIVTQLPFYVSRKQFPISRIVAQ